MQSFNNYKIPVHWIVAIASLIISIIIILCSKYIGKDPSYSMNAAEFYLIHNDNYTSSLHEIISRSKSYIKILSAKIVLNNESDEFYQGLTDALRRNVNIEIITNNGSIIDKSITDKSKVRIMKVGITTNLIIVDKTEFIIGSSIYDKDFIMQNDVIGFYSKNNEIVNEDAKRFFNLMWDSYKKDFKDLPPLKLKTSYDVLAKTDSQTPCNVNNSKNIFSLYFAQTNCKVYPLNRILTKASIANLLKSAKEIYISSSSLSLSSTSIISTNLITNAIKKAKINVLIPSDNKSITSASYIAGMDGIDVRVYNESNTLLNFAVANNVIEFSSGPISNLLLNVIGFDMIFADRTKDYRYKNELLQIFEKQWNLAKPYKDYLYIPFQK